jgi:hypothetical protein
LMGQTNGCIWRITAYPCDVKGGVSHHPLPRLQD